MGRGRDAAGDEIDLRGQDIRSWLQYAESSYVAACELFGNPVRPGFWFPAGLLGHHALELFLKTALLLKGHRIRHDDVWGHDLVTLAEKLAESERRFPDLREELRLFDLCFQEFRYPATPSRLAGWGQEEGEILTRLINAIRPFASKRAD